MDSDSQGLHEGALLEAHVLRQLVAEVGGVDIVSGMSEDDVIQC